MEENVEWRWDADKDEENRRKHRLDFATAQLVFDDPLAVIAEDPYPYERRWRTMGMVGRLLIVVVHTWPELEQRTETLVGRVISARKATAYERRNYEAGLR